MLRLFDYPASANCYKVRLLLGQLGREYERVPVDIFAGETLTPEFAAINPARSTPVLELEPGAWLPGSPGRYLPESGAILAYLAEGSELLPLQAAARAQVLRWLLFEQADVVPAIGGLRFRLLTGRLASGDPEAVRRRSAGLAVLAQLEAHVREHDYLAGRRYSIADIAVYGYAHASHEAGIGLDAYPAFRAWLERVEAQPGFMNDLAPYPANARPGAGRSIYD